MCTPCEGATSTMYDAKFTDFILKTRLKVPSAYYNDMDINSLQVYIKN